MERIGLKRAQDQRRHRMQRGGRRFLLPIWAIFVMAGVAGCAASPEIVVMPSSEAVLAADVQVAAVDPNEVKLPVIMEPGRTTVKSDSRGYLTTPQELEVIAQKAKEGIEPYVSAFNEVIEIAGKKWDYSLDKKESCKSSDRPRWIDDEDGIPRLYARALAYHLTGEEHYAAEVQAILERIMTEVETIDIEEMQCRLNFAWGTPELVASADLIEEYWQDHECRGPSSTFYGVTTLRKDNCKKLFQNWLVKNPYYVISLSAAGSNSNWGAAATNATAYIADYLWDRPEVRLLHRHPPQLYGGQELPLSPSEAYVYANQLMFDRMNGYSVEYQSSSSCDYLSGEQQSDEWEPVKSQISETGVIPEDARREEYCNVPRYNIVLEEGEYQNYPQIHLGNNIQQCELMLRRGDRSCFDNVDQTLVKDFTFIGPDGEIKATVLYPGRGSIERAINAIIIDANTEWRHDEALEIAYRYYSIHHRLPGVDQWFEHLNGRPVDCSQHACFTTLTHGFALDETPELPPVVPAP